MVGWLLAVVGKKPSDVITLLLTAVVVEKMMQAQLKNYSYCTLKLVKASSSHTGR